MITNYKCSKCEWNDTTLFRGGADVSPQNAHSYIPIVIVYMYRWEKTSIRMSKFALNNRVQREHRGFWSAAWSVPVLQFELYTSYYYAYIKGVYCSLMRPVMLRAKASKSFQSADWPNFGGFSGCADHGLEKVAKRHLFAWIQVVGAILHETRLRSLALRSLK